MACTARPGLSAAGISLPPVFMAQPTPKRNCLPRLLLLDMDRLRSRIAYGPDAPSGLIRLYSYRDWHAGSNAGTRAKGYWRINIEGRCYPAHQIVLILHDRWPLPYMIVDHIDRNPSNNRIENLRWATAFENSMNVDAYQTPWHQARYAKHQRAMEEAARI